MFEIVNKLLYMFRIHRNSLATRRNITQTPLKSLPPIANQLNVLQIVPDVNMYPEIVPTHNECVDLIVDRSVYPLHVRYFSQSFPLRSDFTLNVSNLVIIVVLSC